MGEPLTGPDAPAQEGIFRILDELRRREVTVMMATHDLNLASERFDQVMLLNRRLLGFRNLTEVVTTEKLLIPYGGHLHVIQAENGMVMMVEDACLFFGYLGRCC